MSTGGAECALREEGESQYFRRIKPSLGRALRCRWWQDLLGGGGELATGGGLQAQVEAECSADATMHAHMACKSQASDRSCVEPGSALHVGSECSDGKEQACLSARLERARSAGLAATCIVSSGYSCACRPDQRQQARGSTNSAVVGRCRVLPEQC